MRRLPLVVCLALLALPTTAGARPTTPASPAVWTPVAGQLAAARNGHQLDVRPSSYAAFTLDAPGLKAELAGAPMENTHAAHTRLPAVQVAAPDGSVQRFEVVESPVMEPALAATIPGGFTTYAGYGVDDPTATIRLDLSTFGFHASVRSDDGSWYVDPAYHQSTSRYVAYYGDTLKNTHGAFKEGVIRGPHRASHAKAVPGPGDAVQQRIYRLALASDNSYADYHSTLGDDAATVDAKVTAAKGTLMNRVNQLYNDDVAVRMVLVANNNLLNFNTDAAFHAADAYAGIDNCNDPDDALGRNQTVVDAKIGNANYDVGHVMFGANGNGGGVAGLGVVGDPAQKGRGCTGLNQPIGDHFAIDYVAHELGHQFAGNHTFNGDDGGCATSENTRNDATAVEPGSGITIMAYAGICSADNLQGNSDPYFSQRSIDEIQAFITGTPGAGGTIDPTANHAPVVTAPDDKSIPPKTPFTLAGDATDAENHPLVYLWEQNDEGTGTTLGSPPAVGPLFRVFGDIATEIGTQSPAPGQHIATTTDKARTFPDPAQIATDNYKSCPAFAPAPLIVDCYSEFLPASARTMHFRLTARDRYPAGGGVSHDDTTITVPAGFTPFRVTSQSAANAVVANTPLQITWDVGNTTAAPVSTASVRISFSADGGLWFPIEVLASTPNDGTESITVPDLNTTTGRFKVEAIGNYFFDISSGDTTITGGAATVTATPTGTPVPTPTVDPAEPSATPTTAPTVAPTATAAPTLTPTATPIVVTQYAPVLRGTKPKQRIDRRKRIMVRVACNKLNPAGVAPRLCDGRVKLTRKARRATQTVGSKSFSLQGGTAQKLKIKLSQAAVDALPAKITARATVGAQSAAKTLKVKPR